MKLVLAAAALGLLTVPAVAGQLPDNVYRCILGMDAHMGDILIEGASYRGPAYNSAYGDAYGYDVDDQYLVNWGGPLGGLTSDGNSIDLTQVFDVGDGRQGFYMQIRSEGSSGTQRVICSPTR